MKSAG